MIKKPSNWDAVEVMEFDHTPIELGGHKGIIIKAEEYTSDFSGKKSLKVYVDTASDDKQPEYFKKQYENDTRIDRKYPNGAIKYIPLGEEENQVKMLKSFLTCVENSNTNYTYDWSKEVDQLTGKKIGIIFGQEEYISQDGTTKLATKLNQFRSIDKVDNVKIPKVKMLDGSYVSYDDYMERKEDKFADFKDCVEINPDSLPF